MVVLLGFFLPCRVDAIMVVPSRVTTSAGTPFVFVAPGWKVSVMGEMIEGDVLSISASGGRVSLASVSGLAFSEGDGIDDGMMAFSGSRSAINAALAGMSFAPDSGFTGEAELVFRVTGSVFSEQIVNVVVHALLDAEEARNTLLNGVTSIHGGVQPGYLIAFGDQAYDVVLYPDKVAEAMIAVASFGAGRVVAMPDHQMLNMGSYGAQSGIFYKNAIRWAAGDPGLDVAIVTYNAASATWLRNEGYTNVTTTNEAGLVAALANADVFLGGWLGDSEPAGNIAALRAFALGGGGLLIADYGIGYEWWWGKKLHEAPGNLLLREAGIGFSGRSPLGYSSTIPVANRASGQVNATDLPAIVGGDPGYTEDESKRGFWLLSELGTVLPPEDPLLVQIEHFASSAVSSIHPTPASPVTDLLEKALLDWEAKRLQVQAPADMTAHRTAEAVFGSIPPGTPRVTRAVAIDPALKKWQSTGLYAAPGEVVTVTVPPSLVGVGTVIRVNGCTDDISYRPEWLRVPVVSRRFDVTAETFTVGNAFGGAIYVELANPHPGGEPLEVVFSNAVEAPCFVLGENTNQEWIDTLRDLPAPFAELVCDRLAIALPSSMIRDLENPVELMTFWKGVVDRMDYVGGFEQLRKEGERIQIDVQISAGYLHSGYPMMGPFVAGPELVDLAELTRAGSWGWFHELGHEMQRRPDKSWSYNNPYTWDGQVEVTVNIFANAALEYATVNPPVSGHSFSAHPLEVARRAIDSVAVGTSFMDRDRYPFYYQLSDLFDWESYRAVFRSYHDDAINDPAALPANDQQKKDQWLVRWSQATGLDLRSYMVDHWGLEVSAQAIQTTAALGHDPYLPAWGEVQDLATKTGSVSVDLAGGILDYDGGATLVEVKPPARGTIVQGGDQLWHYEATPGLFGSDSFEYVIESSTGHRFTVPVTVKLEPVVPQTQDRVVAEYWFAPAGTTVKELPVEPAFPHSPHEVLYLDDFDTGENRAENYGARLRAYLIPPVSGSYTFWVSGDDSSELWLSPDANPGNSRRIASSDSWTSYRQWDLHGSQQSAPVTLVAGQPYYIEARLREVGGGDHLSVAWSGPSLSRQIIEGHYLQPFVEEGAPPALDGFSLWRHAAGAPASPVALAEDTNADGVADGLAYFFGAPSPAFEARTLNPVFSLEQAGGGGFFHRVEYRSLAGITDLRGKLQFSDRLADWRDAVDGEQGVEIEVIPDGYGSGTDRVIVKLPTTGLDRLFSRVAVSETD